MGFSEPDTSAAASNASVSRTRGEVEEGPYLLHAVAPPSLPRPRRQRSDLPIVHSQHRLAQSILLGSPASGEDDVEEDQRSVCSLSPQNRCNMLSSAAAGCTGLLGTSAASAATVLPWQQSCHPPRLLLPSDPWQPPGLHTIINPLSLLGKHPGRHLHPAFPVLMGLPAAHRDGNHHRRSGAMAGRARQAASRWQGPLCIAT